MGTAPVTKNALDALVERLKTLTWVDSYKITKKEWTGVKKVLAKGNYLYSLSAHVLGFAFYVYTNPTHGKPEKVISINCSDFPEPREQHGLVKMLSVFTHSEKNAEALKRHGFEALKKDLSYYPYA